MKFPDLNFNLPDDIRAENFINCARKVHKDQTSKLLHDWNVKFPDISQKFWQHFIYNSLTLNKNKFLWHFPDAYESTMFKVFKVNKCEITNLNNCEITNLANPPVPAVLLDPKVPPPAGLPKAGADPNVAPLPKVAPPPNVAPDPNLGAPPKAGPLPNAGGLPKPLPPRKIRNAYIDEWSALLISDIHKIWFWAFISHLWCNFMQNLNQFDFILSQKC